MTVRDSLRIVVMSVLAIGGTSLNASAGILLAGDSYATGSNPAAGQYVAGNALSNQPGLVTSGFANNGYTGGAGTTNFVASATGIVSTVDGSDSTTGSVSWIGAKLDGVNRSVARTLSNFNEGLSSQTYWTSILVTYAGNQTTTSGYVLAGFGGTVAPLAPGNTTSGYLQGIFTGFSTETGTGSQADLVIRSRDTTGNKSDQDTVLVANAAINTSYLVVAQINVNPGGSTLDTVNYWVNPGDLNSVADLNNTSLAKGNFSTYSFQGATTGTGDFNRMNYDAVNWDGSASFDEARLGTSLSSIAPAVTVPEPASIALTVVGGCGFVLGTYWRQRRRPSATR